MCVNKTCLSNSTAASFSCWSSFPTPPLQSLMRWAFGTALSVLLSQPAELGAPS